MKLKEMEQQALKKAVQMLQGEQHKKEQARRKALTAAEAKFEKRYSKTVKRVKKVAKKRRENKSLCTPTKMKMKASKKSAKRRMAKKTAEASA